MKEKIQWKWLLALLVTASAFGLLSRLFMAETEPGWIPTVAAIVIAIVLYPFFSVYLLKGEKKRYRISRLILLALVLISAWLYYNAWSNGVGNVKELWKEGTHNLYRNKNIIIGNKLIDEADTALQRLVKEKKWNAVFEYYNSYNPADIWTNDSIAASRRKLNVTLVFLVVMISLLGMHTVESLLFRKKDDEGAGEQVFISYNHKNKKEAVQLAALLRKAEIRTIIDQDDNVAGDKIKDDFIRQSVFESAVILLIVSKESLLSGWVSIEAVSGFFLSYLDKRRKCIACCLDESFRQKGFIDEARAHINQQVAELDKEISKRAESGTGSSDLDVRKDRFIKLRDNLSEILKNLDESLCVDISGDKLEQNFPQILQAVRQKFESNEDAI
jgi:TIR domain